MKNNRSKKYLIFKKKLKSLIESTISILYIISILFNRSY